MTWAIKRAGKEDCDDLALIGAATFLETFAGILSGRAIVAHCRREHSADAYSGQFDKGAHALLALLQPDDAPVGFALIAAADLPGMRDGDVELKRIYVLSRFHGAGLGAALMDRAVSVAKGEDAKRMLLGVYAENERAIAFYRKKGFDPIAVRQFDVGGTSYDDVVLAREL